MPLVSRENRLVRAEAIIPQRSEEKVLDMTKTVRTPSLHMSIVWVAKLMDSTTTVTLLHIRQYGYLPITHHLRYYHCRQANNKMNFGIWTPKNT